MTRLLVSNASWILPEAMSQMLIINVESLIEVIETEEKIKEHKLI